MKVFGQAGEEKRITASKTACTVGFETWFENCLHAAPSGALFLSPEVLHTMDFPSNKKLPAALFSTQLGWIYVDRKGRVIIRDVAPFDNGADEFHEGLVRFRKNGKWGFAAPNGIVVIPAKYDGAYIFENGVARVCIGCHDACTSQNDCEHHTFEGGQHFKIDRRGKVVP